LSFLQRSLLIAFDTVPRSSVSPSAGWRAAYSLPRLDPASVLFSITIRWSGRASSSDRIAQAVTSVEAPGPKPTAHPDGARGSGRGRLGRRDALTGTASAAAEGEPD